MFGVFFSFQKLTQADIHSISYTLSRNQTVVVQYAHDDDSDMFQVEIFVYMRKTRVYICFFVRLEDHQKIKSIVL